MLTARDFNYRSIIEDKDAALRIASEAATNILLGTLDLESCEEAELKENLLEIRNGVHALERFLQGKAYPKSAQVARCGNAVPPAFAEALVRANLPDLCRMAA